MKNNPIMWRENQNTEFKESWRDEYLAWVAGFANAKGGSIIIGKNDKGNATGISDSKRLLEELPNKIYNHLGIQVEVNLLSEQEKELIQINIAPHPTYPVVFKSRYFQRFGTTNQELKGTSLTNFLLSKQGLTFDGVSIPNIGIDKLLLSTIENFKKLATQSGIFNASDVLLSIPELLDKLLLLDSNSEPKRAAVLLFAEEPQRYVAGSYVQLAFFLPNSIIKYKDEVHSDLLHQVTAVIDILKAKYLKANITFDGIQRIDTYPVPDEALRESVINALVHKDYSIPDPVQIKVSNGQLQIWNAGSLPDGWTIENNLLKNHPSSRRNPNLANVFKLAGYIESWGRGIERIIESCTQQGNVTASFEIINGGFQVSFTFPEATTSKETSRETVGTSKETSIETVGTSKETSIETVGTSKETAETSREQILKLLSVQQSLTAKTIAIELKITEKGVRYHLEKLKEEGLILRAGATKKPLWQLVKK